MASPEKFATNSNVLPVDWKSSMKQNPSIRQHLELFASTMAVKQAEQSAETTSLIHGLPQVRPD